jgi:hypothetical protein
MAVMRQENSFFVTHHWTEVDLAGSGGNLPVVT